MYIYFHRKSAATYRFGLLFDVQIQGLSTRDRRNGYKGNIAKSVRALSFKKGREDMQSSIRFAQHRSYASDRQIQLLSFSCIISPTMKKYFIFYVRSYRVSSALKDDMYSMIRRGSATPQSLSKRYNDEGTAPFS